MKVTVQFVNDDTDELCEDMTVEIPQEVWLKLEAKAKEQNCSVDEVVNHTLRTMCRQVEQDVLSE